jgi:hypothetical protein
MNYFQSTLGAKRAIVTHIMHRIHLLGGRFITVKGEVPTIASEETTRLKIAHAIQYHNRKEKLSTTTGISRTEGLHGAAAMHAIAQINSVWRGERFAGNVSGMHNQPVHNIEHANIASTRPTDVTNTVNGVIVRIDESRTLDEDGSHHTHNSPQNYFHHGWNAPSEYGSVIPGNKNEIPSTLDQTQLSRSVTDCINEIIEAHKIPLDDDLDSRMNRLNGSM